MKKVFYAPSISICMLTEEDIMTTSGCAVQPVQASQYELKQSNTDVIHKVDVF